MDICLIMDNPETPRHPVIGVVLRRLSATHAVRLLDVHGLTGDEAIAREAGHPLAKLYLLKGHTLQALRVGQRVEQRGALVVNSWAASLACQDRVLMVRRMTEARLPCPDTWSFPSVENMCGSHSVLSTLRFPLMIKSRYSRRGDLVDKVDNIEQLQALAGRWNEEPCILQELVQGDGWDIRLSIIDQQIFAVRSRTRLEVNAPKDASPIPTDKLPDDWRAMALEIGRVFDLRLYAVDLLMTAQGPLVVDIDSFPGFRGVAGADSALLSLIERLIMEDGSRRAGTCSA